jgi:sulfide:quinone oxidoreductase
MHNKPMPGVYEGYASCPILTGYDTAILAEFNYALQPIETFWFKQNVERFSMAILKREMMAPLYWYGLCNGIWNGPKLFRKIFHLFGKKDPVQ